jgi:nicotinate-nucleotide adenylyltransferase
MTPASAVPATSHRLGILGGTFDPIHVGHIAAADAAQRALSLDSILLIPSRIPPHRAQPATASAEDRFAMAQLAADGRPGWSVSRIEIDREGPSYTFDTLTELAKPASQIFFITGADAFAEIATWSRYPAVLDLANFVVVSRPGITLDSLRERVPSAFRTHPPCSPSDLRALGSEKSRVILVEAHTPDVSSTDIRRRVRTGESLSGLVTDRVAAYISAHGLYLGSQQQMAQK